MTKLDGLVAMTCGDHDLAHVNLTEFTWRWGTVRDRWWYVSIEKWQNDWQYVICCQICIQKYLQSSFTDINLVCKLQLAEISTAASYVGMVMCEWRCVVTATLYVYFVDQCHPYILLISAKSTCIYYSCIIAARMLFARCGGSIPVIVLRGCVTATPLHCFFWAHKQLFHLSVS